MSRLFGGEAGARPASGLRARLRAVAVFAGFGCLALAILVKAAEGPAVVLAKAPPERVTKTLATVEVVDFTPADLSETLSLSGEVKPVRRATVSAEVGGLAGQVVPLPGMSVNAGEVLITIAPDDHRLSLLSEKAALAGLMVQLRTAESNLNRLTRLADRGAASNAALEQAQTAVDVLHASIDAAQAAVALAEANLKRATVRAPINGVIASRSVEPGQLVQAGDPLFEIVDLSMVEVESMVPLSRIPRLHAGQSALFWSPADPSRQIEARVARIAPQAAAGTRSAAVYFEIDNDTEGLRGGTFLAGRIELRRVEGVLALPREAIRTAGDVTSVLAIRDGRAVLVPVTTGDRWNAGRLIEVVHGLRSGDKVVALPLVGLGPGDPVEIARN